MKSLAFSAMAQSPWNSGTVSAIHLGRGGGTGLASGNAGCCAGAAGAGCGAGAAGGGWVGEVSARCRRVVIASADTGGVNGERSPNAL